MSENKHNKKAFALGRIVVVGVIALALLFLFLSSVGRSFVIKHQHYNSSLKLSMAEQRMQENAADADKDWGIYDKFIAEKVNTVSWLIDQSENGIADLPAIAGQWGLDTVYLTDASGNVKFAMGGNAASLDEAGLSRLKEYAEGKDDHPYKTVDDVCYYICSRSDGRYLVGGVESAEMIAAQDERFTAGYSLKNMKVGSHGFIMAFDPEDGTILYIPDEKQMGCNIKDVLGKENFEDGTTGWIDYNNGRWYYESARAESEGKAYTLLAMASEADITESSDAIVWTVMAVCILTLIFMVLYALFLESDDKKNGASDEKYYRINDSWLLDLNKGKKMLSVLSVGLVVLIAITAYLESMTMTGRQMVKFEDRLASVDETLAGNDARTEEIVQRYEEEYSRRTENIAWSLKYNPALVNDDKLEELSEVSGVRDIDVFNSAGVKDATSSPYKDFTLSNNEDDQSYIFWNVVKGYEPLIAQEAQLNESTGTLTQYIGGARRDAPGMVQIAIEPELLSGRLESSDIDHILDNLAVENGGFLFAADKESGELRSYPDDSYVGKDISTIGMKQKAVKDMYTGWQKIDGSRCFVMSCEHNDDVIFAAVPSSRVFEDVIPVTLITGCAGLIMMLLIMLSIMLTSAGSIENRVREMPGKSDGRIFELTGTDGKTRRSESAAGRWEGGYPKFRELGASDKIGRLIKIILACAAILILIANVTGVLARNKLMAFVLSGKWEHAINLFSVSYVIFVVILTIAVSVILRMIISKVTTLGSSRMETMGRLINSFIKYIAVLGAIFYGLQFFGVDSKTMLAGAGILSIVIGLGAQSLIADILAGLFIVFEGEFRVGDIVTIGDWRGTVEEIGIRTTKIKSPGQDVKIFRNSNISGVINQTRQYSFASIDVGIEYGESLERVESILKTELPHIKEHVKEIVDGPYYKGVSELADSSVVIKIAAQCLEKDRVQVVRDLNREIKIIFDRNDIGIPFPQIVLNQAVVHEKANDSEKRDANEFVKEQKEMGKDVENAD